MESISEFYCNVGELIKAQGNKKSVTMSNGRKINISTDLISNPDHQNVSAEIKWLLSLKDNDDLSDVKLKMLVDEIEESFGMNLANAVKNGKIRKVCINLVNGEHSQSKIEKSLKATSASLNNPQICVSEVKSCNIPSFTTSIQNNVQDACVMPAEEIEKDKNNLMITNVVSLNKASPAALSWNNIFSNNVCMLCGFSTTDEMDQIHHLIIRHKQIPPFRDNDIICPKCQFQTKDIFVAHKMDIDKSPQIVCGECGQVKYTYHNLDFPKTNGGSSSIEEEDEPQLPVTTEGGLEKVLPINVQKTLCFQCRKTHIIGKYTCRNCSFATTCPIALEDHMSKMHQSTHVYHCPVCGFNTKSYSRIELHLIVKHTDRGEENSVKKTLPNQKTSYHKQKKKVNPVIEKITPEIMVGQFKCLFCTENPEFTNSDVLKEHFGDIHMKKKHYEKPMSCRHCSFKCVTHSAMLGHNKDKHKDFSPQYLFDSAKYRLTQSVLNQMMIACTPVAGSGSSVVSLINSNIAREIPNEAPNIACHQNSSLTESMPTEKKKSKRLASSDKNASYDKKMFAKCVDCKISIRIDGTFKYGNLRKHLIMHEVETPYSCLLCGQNFKEKEIAQKHISKHDTTESGILLTDTHMEAIQESNLEEKIKLCPVIEVKQSDHTYGKNDSRCSLYKCSVCNKQGFTSIKIKKHIREKHYSKSGAFVVMINSAGNEKRLLDKKKNPTDKKKMSISMRKFPIQLPSLSVTKRDELFTFRCTDCSHTMRHSKQVEEHCLQKHLKMDARRCKHCMEDSVLLIGNRCCYVGGHVFTENELYEKCALVIKWALLVCTVENEHVTKNFDFELSCPICSYTFTNMKSAEAHFLSVHKGKPLFVNIKFYPVGQPESYKAIKPLPLKKRSILRKGLIMEASSQKVGKSPNDLTVTHRIHCPRVIYIQNSYVCSIHNNDIERCVLAYCHICNFVIKLCFEEKYGTGKNAISIHFLNKHVKSEFGHLDVYKCKKCERRFFGKSPLKHHLKKAHYVRYCIDSNIIINKENEAKVMNESQKLLSEMLKMQPNLRKNIVLLKESDCKPFCKIRKQEYKQQNSSTCTATCIENMRVNDPSHHNTDHSSESRESESLNENSMKVCHTSKITDVPRFDGEEPELTGLKDIAACEKESNLMGSIGPKIGNVVNDCNSSPSKVSLDPLKLLSKASYCHSSLKRKLFYNELHSVKRYRRITRDSDEKLFSYPFVALNDIFHQFIPATSLKVITLQ